MTTAGSAGTPRVSLGPFVNPRFGRPSTPPATYLWLMVAILHELALARAITWIALTRRRLPTAGAVLPTTLRISGTLAAVSAAAEKVLVNARRALHGAVTSLTLLLVTSTTTAFRGTVKWRTGRQRADQPQMKGHLSDHTRIGRDTGTRNWAGHRIPARNLVKIAGPAEIPGAKINNSANPQNYPRRTPQQPIADFFRGK